QRIHIGGRKEYAGNRRATKGIAAGTKLGSRQDLRSEIGSGADQEPGAGVDRESDLGLRARTAANCAVAKACAIGAVAVPLRETAAGGRTENLNAHGEWDRGSTGQQEEFYVCRR